MCKFAKKLTLFSYSAKKDSITNLFKVANEQIYRLDQIMPKVLTLSKCFKSSAIFATTFGFADAERIILLLLIIAVNKVRHPCC